MHINQHVIVSYNSFNANLNSKYKKAYSPLLYDNCLVTKNLKTKNTWQYTNKNKHIKCICLTHFQPMFHFSIPWKNLLSDISRTYRSGTLVGNGLNCEYFPCQAHSSYVLFGSFSQILVLKWNQKSLRMKE